MLDDDYEGKTAAEVLDFLVLGNRNLAKHSMDRLRSYQKEPEFKIRVVRNI